MNRLSQTAVDGLRGLGIDPGLVAALELREVADGVFDIPCQNMGGQTVPHRWILNGKPQPWPADEGPAVWWPMGRGGPTAIVVVGASSALLIASLLFRVGHDGAIYPRANLPAVLADAVPVCLPETAAGLPVEWIYHARGVEELMGELCVPERTTTFLAVPRAPAEMPIPDPGIETFIDDYLATAASCELLPALALLPPGTAWPNLLSPFRGAAKTAALAGVLEYWRRMALCAPVQTTEGGPP